MTLLAGAEAAAATLDVSFRGAAAGEYAATLTIDTDSGAVVYALSATVVPEPAAPALLALTGLAGLRRRHA